MKKELTEEEKQITKKVVDGLTNDSSEELINLMKECNISDGVISTVVAPEGQKNKMGDTKLDVVYY